MDDYLAKPVRLEAIRHALARWLPSDADSSDDTGAAPVRPIQVPDDLEAINGVRDAIASGDRNFVAMEYAAGAAR